MHVGVILFLQVEHPHQRADNLLADFCDGEAFRNHPLFSVDPTALQILLYYDEIEIVNPLGSKTSKHKLGTEKVDSMERILLN
jgi:hypothetical protein